MTTQLTTFEFQSRQLRVEADEHGNPWFCAKDACDILGYANDSDAIKKHCKPEGVANRYPLQTAGGIQYPTFINEGNLYRLIIKSNKPQAEPFERKVCDEILPTIRKTGGYLALPRGPLTLAELGRHLAALDETKAAVLALPVLVTGREALALLGKAAPAEAPQARPTPRKARRPNDADVSPEEVALILERHKAGESSAYIAGSLERNPSTVRSVIHRHYKPDGAGVAP